MTFWGEHVFFKKIKANPESSMLIPEFCVNLKQKQNSQEGEAEVWSVPRLAVGLR